MLINGIRWQLRRSGPKRREYQYGRWNVSWILSSSLMNTLGGDQMASNVLASCRGCSHTPKRWDAKNANGLSVEAACNWSLGRTLRQKLWSSRWWDSGPPGRRSKGSIMKCTNKRGYQGPHHMGQNRWRPLIGESALLWMSRCGRGGVPPCWKRIGGSHCEYFVAQLPDKIPLLDPGKE